MALLADYVLDLALAEVASSDTLWICTTEPTNYTQASSTYAKGSKSTPTIGAPANRTPDGRKVTVAAITGGSVTGDGTVGYWALTKGTAITAAGPLGASKVVATGDTFTLPAFDIGIPDAVTE